MLPNGKLMVMDMYKGGIKNVYKVSVVLCWWGGEGGGCDKLVLVLSTELMM